MILLFNFLICQLCVIFAIVINFECIDATAEHLLANILQKNEFL